MDYLFSIFKKNEEVENEILLNNFLQNISWGNIISPQKANENIYNNLIEFIYNGKKHAFNGLLISPNGHVLTCHHCIDCEHKDIRNIEGRTLSGQIFKIEKVCISRKNNDLAMLKLATEGYGGNYLYKFEMRNFGLSEKIPVFIFSIWDRKIKIIAGNLLAGNQTVEVYDEDIEKYSKYKNHLKLEVNSRLGDSGGVVTTMDGNIVGFLSSVSAKTFIAYSSSMIDCFNMVSEYNMSIS